MYVTVDQASVFCLSTRMENINDLYVNLPSKSANFAIILKHPETSLLGDSDSKLYFF